jgi:hypothetical protein
MPASHARRLGGALSLFALTLLLGGLPSADAAAPQPASAPAPFAAPAPSSPGAIAPFLDDVLASVDTYWHQTDAAAGRPAPSVAHDWVAPGTKVSTACGAAADDNAAFYCPTDDTIYIGQTFAGNLFNGVAQGLPGEKAGYGHAVGDFAVAYVVAHEFGHNVQQEAGQLTGRRSALPTELNADCLAGTWGHWAYGQGELDPGDTQEALNAALAVGDFDFLSPQHHGTPQQRHDALQTGLDSATTTACDKYLSM